MNGCFVRLLFGDELVDGYPGLLNDLATRGKDTIKPEPCLWFTCGAENFAAVKAAGFDPKSLWYDSVPSDDEAIAPDYVAQYGAARYGRNLYYLKFKAVAEAMRMGYDHVVFLDLDVEQVKPLHADFWEDLEFGKPIQAPLVQYHRVQCPWRKECPRTSIYCATAYFRGLRTVERCLELADQYPMEFEQAAINRAIDELAGGEFPGHDGYREKDFEFPFTEQVGGMIHKPVEPLFRIHSKGHSEWKRKGIEAWKAYVVQRLAEKTT